MNTKKYNLGIWVSDKLWHVIKIKYPVLDSFDTKTLCNNELNHFFSGYDPKWIYPYYRYSNDTAENLPNVPATKKTLCQTCLKLSKLSWNDIAQYLINIKVGAINAEESQIRKNKITPNIQKFKR